MCLSRLLGNKSKVGTSTLPKKSLRSSMPTKEGKCQDVAFLMLYLVFAAYFLLLFAFVLRYCTLSYFWSGVDSWGNVCGSGHESPQRIDGVPGSGTVKIEFPYVWKTTFSLNCNQTAAVDGVVSLRLCVKACPNVTIGPPVCNLAIQQNGYGKLKLARQECQAIEKQDETEDCPTKWSRNIRRPQTILNRCMDSMVLSSGYVEIQGYLVLLHYFINDILNTATTMGSIVGAVIVTSIFTGFVCAKFPKHATTFCYIFGISLAALSSVCLGGTVVDSFSIQPATTASSTVRWIASSLVPFAVLLVFYGTVVMTRTSYSIYKDTDHFTNIARRGIWRSTSLCIRENPKILSQPIITLLATAATTLFFGFLSLTVYSCGDIKRSPTADTLEFQLGNMNWLVLICPLGYIWLVALIGRGQDSMLAGAVAEWYFRKPKHPLTASLKYLLKYNLGCLAATSFRGLDLDKVAALTCKSDKAAFVVPYFSVFSPLSIGVYGKVRSLRLTEQASKDNIVKKVQREFNIARNSLKAIRTGVPMCSVCIFIVYAEVHMHVPLVPTLVLMFTCWYVTGVFCDAAMITMGSMSVCLIEDFENNDGINLPYFCRNDVALHLLGIVLPKSATYEGRQRMRQIEGQITKMHAKASLVFRRYSDIEQILQSTKKGRKSKTGKMEETTRQDIGVARSERSIERKNVSESKSVVTLLGDQNSEIGAASHSSQPEGMISRDFVSAVDVQEDKDEDLSMRFQEFPTEVGIGQQNNLEGDTSMHKPDPDPVRPQIQSSVDIRSERAEEGNGESRKELTAAKLPLPSIMGVDYNLKQSSNLVTFEDLKSSGRWKKFTIAAVKAFAPEWAEDKKETKIISTVKNEERCDNIEWDDWWE